MPSLPLLRRLRHRRQRRRPSLELEPGEARVEAAGSEERSVGSLFDPAAGLAFAVRQAALKQLSARPPKDQPIIAAAAAAPMANMQISWMENSVKRTLTTALVWRSAT